MSEHQSRSETAQSKVRSARQSNKTESDGLGRSIDNPEVVSLKAMDNASEKSGEHEKSSRLQAMADSSSSLKKSGIAQLQTAADSKASSINQLQSAAGNLQHGYDNVTQKKSNDSGLPASLKSGIESLSGMSMNNVKVHYNSTKPAQLQAHAYAQGNDIHLASGQEKHLPHEAWHTVQQKQGRVKPTRQLKSKVAINDNSELEKEADIMGSKAQSLGFNASPKTLKSPKTSTEMPAQLFKFWDKFNFRNLFKNRRGNNRNTSSIGKTAPSMAPPATVESDQKNEMITYPESEKPHLTVQELMVSHDVERARGVRPGNLSPTDDNWSAAKKAHINPDSKASPILNMTSQKEVDSWYGEEKNSAYGTIGYGQNVAPGDEAAIDPSQNVDRLNKFLMSPAKSGAFGAIGYHITPSEWGAKSVAKGIDPSFHNSAGRFGGGFHVADSPLTGAMELYEHRNDLKKKARKDTKGSEEDKQKAYEDAEELKPTNMLTYRVNLEGSKVLDTTHGLTAMAKSTPKIIENGARQEGYDGIIFKSMRGPGKNLVAYKNYHKIFHLQNKRQEQTAPTKFSKSDLDKRDELLTHKDHERSGISERLYEKPSEK